MKYSVAGYNLELKGDCIEYVSNMMRNYEANFAKADFTVTYTVTDKIILKGKNDVKGAGRFSWSIDQQNEEITAYSYADKYDLCLSSIKWNKDFNRADILVVDSCPLGGYSVDLQIFGLVGQAFYYMLMMHHCFVFHASAISYKGNGILFSAPSGTGKSTQTNMWKDIFNDDVVFINDDNPVLKIIGDAVYVYGTPWAGSSSINTNISAKVKAIICLEQYDKIEISELKGFESFFRIYNETNKPVLKEMLDVFLEDLNILLSKVNVYLMKCNLTVDTVYEIKKILALD